VVVCPDCEQVTCALVGATAGVGVGVPVVGVGVGVGGTGVFGNVTATVLLPVRQADWLQAFTEIAADVSLSNDVLKAVFPFPEGTAAPLTVQLVLVKVPSIVAVQFTSAFFGAAL
jgi:hypothetical protein